MIRSGSPRQTATRPGSSVAAGLPWLPCNVPGPDQPAPRERRCARHDPTRLKSARFVVFRLSEFVLPWIVFARQKIAFYGHANRVICTRRVWDSRVGEGRPKSAYQQRSLGVVSDQRVKLRLRRLETRASAVSRCPPRASGSIGELGFDQGMATVLLSVPHSALDRPDLAMLWRA